LLTLCLLACGSADGRRATGASTAGGGGASAPTALAVATTPAGSTTPATPAQCASTVAGTLGTVAQRIYREASTGSIVGQAVHRVQSSAALAQAIDGDDATAARAALRSLALGQVVGVQVIRGGRVFARVGARSAIAPVRGSIAGTSASFVLTTQSYDTYLKVANQVTGAQVLLLAGPASAHARRLASTLPGLPAADVPAAGALTYAGRDYQVVSLNGAAYPSGPLRIALLVPASAISCPASTAQARVETLGHVGERIYQEELRSPTTAAVVRQIERTPSFARAVGAHDVAATQAGIVGFFKAHIHVVRVRVTVGGRLLTDVGGPYALAPVHGTLRSGGRVVGRFVTAVQDDAGYLRLARLFTGAQVLMRTPTRQVMGTLTPGPASVPNRGQLSYGGRTYEAYSFTGEAFPSGPLRISLLY
jgi:hypothetical protein